VKVLVSVPHGAAAGNVLRSGVVDRVIEAHPDAEVVLASPLSRDDAFAGEFRRDRVHFEDLPPHRPAGLEARLLALVQAAYIDSGVTESVRIRRDEASAKKTIRRIRAKRVLASILAPSTVRARSRYDLSDRLVSHPAAESLFERHRPALYIASSPGLIFAETLQTDQALGGLVIAASGFIPISLSRRDKIVALRSMLNSYLHHQVGGLSPDGKLDKYFDQYFENSRRVA